MQPLSRFIAATGLTNLGDGVALIAWGWMASLLTRDPLLIAMVPVALKSPWFVLSLPAGIIVDRIDRKRLILGADILRALAYAAAALAIWRALPLPEAPARGTSQPLTFALIALAAITVGAAEVLRDNAAQTILPAIVPEEALERANGRLWTVEFIMNNFVGTALAGVLLTAFLPLPFALIALAMALAALLVRGLKGDFRADPEGQAPRAHWRVELREGIAYLLGQPILRGLAVMTGLFNFAFEAMMVTLVLIVQERLSLGPLAMSAIMASGAAGGVAAGLVNDRIVARLGRARSLQFSMAVAPVFPACVLLAGPGWLPLICAGFFISEFGGIVWNTVSVSYRQRSIPRRLLGRVNSAYRLFAIGMAPLGMLVAGLLTRAMTEPFGRAGAILSPFAMGFIVLAVTGALYWRFLGRFERPKAPR